MERKTRKPSELAKIKKIIKLCEKSNINRIRWDNVEIEFNESEGKQTKLETKYERKKPKYIEEPQADMPPDDIMLFASTQHFDAMLDGRKTK